MVVILSPLNAVVLFSTGEPENNTVPPEGALTNSGWQLQGAWNLFLGTPVGSNYFITARHTGGTPGTPFLFAGRTFTTTAKFDHPVADLTLWRVAETFPSFAGLYVQTNELDRDFIVFGRGRRRGEEVKVDGALRGWRWGEADLRMRWGVNRIQGITNLRGSSNISTNEGEFLRATFDPGGGPNEAHLSNGDSGGAAFILNGSEWRLAGISSAADGGYNTNDSGEGFQATLFDERALYKGSRRSWTLQTSSAAQPGAFYMVRISSYARWMQRIIEFGNAKGPMWVEEAASPEGPFSSISSEIDPSEMIVRIAVPISSRFYRLRALEPIRIISITNSAQRLLLRYE